MKVSVAEQSLGMRTSSELSGVWRGRRLPVTEGRRTKHHEARKWSSRGKGEECKPNDGFSVFVEDHLWGVRE